MTALFLSAMLAFGNEVISTGAPTALDARLQTQASASLAVDALALAPNNTWVVVSQNRVYTSATSPSSSLVTSLQGKLSAGKTITAVVFAPVAAAGGQRWLHVGSGGLATNDQAYFSSIGLYSPLSSAVSSGKNIQSIGIDSTGQWVFVADGVATFSASIPAALRQVLADVGSVQRRRLHSVSLGYGKWSVVADNWFASSVRTGWAEDVWESAARGEKLHRVQFGPSASVAATHRRAPADPFDAIAGLTLAQTMENADVPGLAIAVYKDGRLVMAREYGFLVEGGAERATVRSAWPVASVSKMFTGTVLGQAAANGELDLYRASDEVYDPAGTTAFDQWYREEGEEFVFLFDLFGHTAGLNTHGYGLFPLTDQPTLTELLLGDYRQYAVDHGSFVAGSNQPPVRPLRDADGLVPSGYKYSGGGIQVGQAWMEAETGRSLQSLAQSYAFSPLGTTTSTFQSAAFARGTAPLAQGYKSEEGLAPRSASPAQAAGGLTSTALELGRWTAALANDGWVQVNGQWRESLNAEGIGLQLRPSMLRDEACSAVDPCGAGGTCVGYPEEGGYCVELPHTLEKYVDGVEVDNKDNAAVGEWRLGDEAPLYGLGTKLSTSHSEDGWPDVAWHDGSADGIRTRAKAFPNTGWAFVILANGGDTAFLDVVDAHLVQRLGVGQACSYTFVGEVTCGGTKKSWW